MALVRHDILKGKKEAKMADIAWTLDRFIKTFFWNFQKCKTDLCYIMIDKQMLEKVFCSNIAPSLSSGNHPLHGTELPE